jgi:hypothetical protein
MFERSRFRPRPSWLLDVLGGLVFVLALAATARTLANGVGYYDEGIILTNAKLLGWGFVPYRDFYSNYPPGIFLTVAAVWKLVGVRVLAVRGLGLFIHVMLALLAGRLAGRLAERRFSAITSGLVLAWLVPLHTVPYAWIASLTALLLFLELFACVVGTERRWLAAAAGVALGAASWYRHDLFCYFAVALGAGLLACRVLGKTLPLVRWRWLAGGVAVALVVFWIPTFVRAGIRPVLFDLYFDQVRYVLPARKLPYPSLFTLGAHHLPAFLGLPFPAAVAWAFVGPVLALATLAWAWHGRSRWLVLALSAAALAVLPQMLGRTDLPHALYVVAPVLIFAGALVERLAALPGRRLRFVLGGGLGALLLALALFWPSRESVWPLRTPGRIVEPGLGGERRALVTYVQTHTQPGEPIYAGYTQHRRLLVNEVDLYYYLDRPGSTRYLQYDPNVINRPDVQAVMAQEIEQKKVRLVVLETSGGIWDEPNESRRLGADVLDQYLARHFTRVTSFGPYEVRVRNPVP